MRSAPVAPVGVDMLPRFGQLSVGALVIATFLPGVSLPAASEATLDGVTIPIPRVGDAIDEELLETDWYQGTAYVSRTLRTRSTWVGPPAEHADGWGRAHLAYPVVREFSCELPRVCPDGERILLDVATREVVVSEGNSWGGGSNSYVGLGVAHAHGINRHTTPLTWYGPLFSYEHALQGRHLAAGETVEVALPRSPTSPDQSGWARFAGVDWELHDGQALFRVEVEIADPEWPYRFTIWFDGLNATPARFHSFWGSASNGYQVDVRIVGRTAGNGSELVDSSYTPPTGQEWRSDVLRVPMTQDGPDEPVLDAFPLEHAAATARTHADAAPWLALHPGAYLVSGDGFEYPIYGETTWFLTFADGAEWLRVEVRAPWSAFVAAPVGRVIAVEEGASTRPWPGWEQVEGMDMACSGEAWRLARTTATKDLDKDAHLIKVARFWIGTAGGGPRVYCSVAATRYVPDAAGVQPIQTGGTHLVRAGYWTETAVIGAAIEGVSGGFIMELGPRGRDEKSYAVHR